MNIDINSDKISITFDENSAQSIHSILSVVLKTKLDSCDSLVLFNDQVAEFSLGLSAYYQGLESNNQLPERLKSKRSNYKSYRLNDGIEFDSMFFYFIEALRRSGHFSQYLDSNIKIRENYLISFFSPVHMTETQLTNALEKTENDLVELQNNPPIL